jgi:hypothetical protein
VQVYLVRNGFKVTEVTGQFGDDLDLLASPMTKSRPASDRWDPGPLGAVTPQAEGRWTRTVLARA